MRPLWKTIDLDRHGVIEAHAGTGKTYTIVKLVLEIVQRKITDESGGIRCIHIREVLLVTFTEKAAGELKKRIREELGAAIAALPPDNALCDHLKNCLNTLHEALIGTIHSVCLRLLRSWPFESGAHFDTEITDDAEGLKSTLRQSMRTDWQEEKSGIPWALQRMAKAGIVPNEGLFALIRRTAKELLDDQFTALDRDIVDGHTLPELQALSAEIVKQQEEVREYFNHRLAALVAAFVKIHESGRLKPDKQHLCQKRICQLQEMIDTGVYRLKILKNANKSGSSSIYVTKEIGKIPGTEAAEEHLQQIAVDPFIMLLQQEQKMVQHIRLALICDAAGLTAKRWTDAKQTLGLLSYQDMLRLMHKAVTGHPAFSASLRKKIRYAIIDEFQDTSRLQWEVFRELFVAAPVNDAPRFYIVGDPKQSIYAFQGADVNSYLDARNAIVHNGGQRYTLGSNFRSLEATVAAYNAVFTSDDMTKNWFLFDDSVPGIQYPPHLAVTTPQRVSTPKYPLPLQPFQVMALGGSAPARMKQMAHDSARVIQRLLGTTISVPDGLGWREVTLGYSDFAVIVEAHYLASPFLDEFRDRRIPAIKYKMEGVFQSSMARALHALLQALLFPTGKPAPRLALLLTPFFNRKPEAINPEHALEPCNDLHCKGETLCIAHALEVWTGLVSRSLWAQLFENIQHLTGIRERLLRLYDGERQLADLRQIIDYCIEYLYCNKYSISHLCEHLKGLIEGEVVAGEDQNLHVLETDKSSVKVLTMHASKGLEFPVVFVVTGESRKAGDGPGFIRYSNTGSTSTAATPSILIAPYATVDDIQITMRNGRSLKEHYLQQANQERRRLLYVALTRAQALLFVPMHFTNAIDKSSLGRWKSLEENAGFDRDLTPKLIELLDAADAKGPIALFDENTLASINATAAAEGDHLPVADLLAGMPDIVSLKLFSRICRQTSYSQLSREAHVARNVDKSEEVDETGYATENGMVPSLLPGGTTTGDALHCALEEILAADSARAIVNDPEKVRSIVAKYLSRSGILARLQRLTGGKDAVVDSAVATACSCITGALSTSLKLPCGVDLAGVATLLKVNLLPEMEFLLNVEQHWVHGFMDLVFRTPNPAGGAHPWRYFVLDWKSDTLSAYSMKAIDLCIHRRHYDLQAQLYSHALDRYLRGILGPVYDPAEHLGGAAYLFLREHEKTYAPQATAWTYRARPQEDARFVREKVKATLV